MFRKQGSLSQPSQCNLAVVEYASAVASLKTSQPKKYNEIMPINREIIELNRRWILVSQLPEDCSLESQKQHLQNEPKQHR